MRSELEAGSARVAVRRSVLGILERRVGGDVDGRARAAATGRCRTSTGVVLVTHRTGCGPRVGWRSHSTTSRRSSARARVGAWCSTRSQPIGPSGWRQCTVAGWNWPRAWSPDVAGLSADHRGASSSQPVASRGGESSMTWRTARAPWKRSKAGRTVGGHPHADVLEHRGHAHVVAVGHDVGVERWHRGGQVRRTTARGRGRSRRSRGPCRRPGEYGPHRFPSPACHQRAMSFHRAASTARRRVAARQGHRGRCQSPSASRSIP